MAISNNRKRRRFIVIVKSVQWLKLKLKQSDKRSISQFLQGSVVSFHCKKRNPKTPSESMASVLYSPSPLPAAPRRLRSNLINDTSTSSLHSNLRLPIRRYNGKRCTWRSAGIICFLAKAKEPSSPRLDTLLREPHKYFDQVVITVRSGDGGHGSILNLPDQKTNTKSQVKSNKGKGKRKISYKRDSDGSLILPMGGPGGDVVIYADENLDSLLEFHKQSRYNAKRGGNVDAMGTLTRQLQNGLAAPTLRIPVPVGTAVKRKRGKLLADLAVPGDEVLVARGGQGGMSLLDMPEHRRNKMMGMTTNLLRDDSDKVLAFGQQGEEISLELILRVVADVGLVGLPNAGKSTLLSAITHAKPEIADYPFTTLMPNLGRLDGDPTLGAEMFSSETTLADLPGLIEGAHLGKGLGRNFLRHLRRTRLLVHVVDAAAEDPVKDYRTVKEELRMYNPGYLERPYLVVLNKIDLPQAKERLPYLTEEIMKIGRDEVAGEIDRGSRDSVQPSFTEIEHSNELPSFPYEENEREREIEDYPPPLAVVGVSVLKGIQVNEMLKEIRMALRKIRDSTQQLPTEQILEQPQM